MEPKHGQTSCWAVIPVYVSLSLYGGLAEDEMLRSLKHLSCTSLAKLFRFLAEWLSSKELLWSNKKDDTSLWSPEKLSWGILQQFVD